MVCLASSMPHPPHSGLIYISKCYISVEDLKVFSTLHTTYRPPKSNFKWSKISAQNLAESIGFKILFGNFPPSLDDEKYHSENPIDRSDSWRFWLLVFNWNDGGVLKSPNDSHTFIFVPLACTSCDPNWYWPVSSQLIFLITQISRNVPITILYFRCPPLTTGHLQNSTTFKPRDVGLSKIKAQPAAPWIVSPT